MRRLAAVLAPLALVAHTALAFTFTLGAQAPAGATVLAAHDAATDVGSHPWTHGTGTAVDVGQTFRLPGSVVLEGITVKVRPLSNLGGELVVLRVGTYTDAADFTMNEVLRAETGQLPADLPVNQVVYLTFDLQYPVTLAANEQAGFVFSFAGGGGVNDARAEVLHLGGNVLPDGQAIADFGSFTEARAEDVVHFLHGTANGGAEPPDPEPEPVATFILPSSARAPGHKAFWTTDLAVMNTGAEAAKIRLKLLGHEEDGANGPEKSWTIEPLSTVTWFDVLRSLFERDVDWGPILIASSTADLVIQGQTWTAAPSGGSCGQSVPALGTGEAVGGVPKALVGVRQDTVFRTNIVLANPGTAEAAVKLEVLRPDGSTAKTHMAVVGPLGFLQLNLADHLGVTNLVGGSILATCTTPGARVAVYASVIDAASADPRTILAR